SSHAPRNARNHWGGKRSGTDVLETGRSPGQRAPGPVHETVSFTQHIGERRRSDVASSEQQPHRKVSADVELAGTGTGNRNCPVRRSRHGRRTVLYSVR